MTNRKKNSYETLNIKFLPHSPTLGLNVIKLTNRWKIHYTQLAANSQQPVEKIHPVQRCGMLVGPQKIPESCFEGAARQFLQGVPVLARSDFFCSCKGGAKSSNFKSFKDAASIPSWSLLGVPFMYQTMVLEIHAPDHSTNISHLIFPLKNLHKTAFINSGACLNFRVPWFSTIS